MAALDEQETNPLDERYAYALAACGHGNWNTDPWMPFRCPKCGKPCVGILLSPGRHVTIYSYEEPNGPTR